MSIDFDNELVQAARNRDGDRASSYEDLVDKGEGTYYPDEVTKVVVDYDKDFSFFNDDSNGEFASGVGRWMWLKSDNKGGGETNSVMDPADRRKLAQLSIFQEYYTDEDPPFSEDEVADALESWEDAEIYDMFRDEDEFNDALGKCGIEDVRAVMYRGSTQSEWGIVLVKGDIELARDVISHWDDPTYVILLYRAPDIEHAERDWYELVDSIGGVAAG